MKDSTNYDFTELLAQNNKILRKIPKFPSKM